MAYTKELLTANFKTQPYDHQAREFELHGLDEARALLWQMRCGKTKATIDSACALWHKGEIDAVLIFAPNGVHANWIERELPAHQWPDVPNKTFTWITSKCSKSASWQNELRAAIKDKTQLVWLAVNSEVLTQLTVRKITDAITANRKVLIVFDESHNYRVPSSKRTKRARALAKRCPYRRILTGTPITNNPLHAFSQYELLQPSALGFDTFEDFKNYFAVFVQQQTKNGRRYPALKEYRNLTELTERMAKWSSVVRREDCDDLPSLIKRTRHIELTPQQVAAYNDVHAMLQINVGRQVVDISEGASRISKLQQIVSGFVIDECGETYRFPGTNPRIEALIDEVMACSGKVIVWCNYRNDLDLVYEELSKQSLKCVQYCGKTKERDRQEVRKLFAPDAENDIKVLVGQPMAGGQGLNLSAASKIVWYSHTFDAIVRSQADERATKVGGKNIEVVDIAASGVDEYILENLSNKRDIAKAISEDGIMQVLERIKIQ